MTATSDAGPLAGEAAALVEAALAWAQRAATALGPDTHACTACPLCRAVSALREPSPELSDRLTASVTDLATAVAAGLRMAFDGPNSHQPHKPDDPPHGHAQGGVEHIDIL